MRLGDFVGRPVKRSVPILLLTTLLVGALLGHPAAARGGGCPAFDHVEPESPSSQTAEALEAGVIRVGVEATEENPLLIEYEHGPAFWELGHRLQEDVVFFNFQVVGATKKGLHLRPEYTNEYVNELDIFLYAEDGERVASSATFGLVPQFSDPGNGGIGYEYIPGFRAQKCQGFTLESRAIWSVGMDATLQVWLGPIGKNIPNEDDQEG